MPHARAETRRRGHALRLGGKRKKRSLQGMPTREVMENTFTPLRFPFEKVVFFPEKDPDRPVPPKFATGVRTSFDFLRENASLISSRDGQKEEVAVEPARGGKGADAVDGP